MKIKELQYNTNTKTFEDRKGWEKHGRRTADGDKIVSKPTKVRFIELQRGRFIDDEEDVFPIQFGNEKNFKRVYYDNHALKFIYCIEQHIENSSNMKTYIGLNWKQNQRFLFMQKSHWIQQESNLRYIVNIIFLIIGVYIGIRQIPS